MPDVGKSPDPAPRLSRLSSGPTCAACSAPAVAQWQRRSAEDPSALVAVLACGDHVIERDTAAQVHAADCPAPDPKQVPACGCTPEPLPAPEPAEVGRTVTLATGWVVPAPE